MTFINARRLNKTGSHIAQYARRVVNQLSRYLAIQTGANTLLLLLTFFNLAAGPVKADGVIELQTPATTLPAYPGAYVEIIKSEQLLRVRRGDRTYREYPIAYGRGDRGAKEILGDKKTPEGIYRIAGINDSERFHLFLRLNYPNVKDAFYGLKNNIISRHEFDRIIDALRRGHLPPQDTALGGAIGIHGVGIENEKKLKIHANMNWTEGCIALTNAEVSELRQIIRIGTEVVIKP